MSTISPPTSAELAILRVLWIHGPATVRQINNIMAADRPIGYSTTLKMVQIMTEKGLLLKDESVKPQVFKPARAEARTQLQLIDDLIQRAFGGSPSKLVLRAAAAKRITPRELVEIKELIERRKQTLGETHGLPTRMDLDAFPLGRRGRSSDACSGACLRAAAGGAGPLSLQHGGDACDRDRLCRDVGRESKTISLVAGGDSFGFGFAFSPGFSSSPRFANSGECGADAARCRRTVARSAACFAGGENQSLDQRGVAGCRAGLDCGGDAAGHLAGCGVDQRATAAGGQDRTGRFRRPANRQATGRPFESRAAV